MTHQGASIIKPELFIALVRATGTDARRITDKLDYDLNRVDYDLNRVGYDLHRVHISDHLKPFQPVSEAASTSCWIR